MQLDTLVRGSGWGIRRCCEIECVREGEGGEGTVVESGGRGVWGTLLTASSMRLVLISC